MKRKRTLQFTAFLLCIIAIICFFAFPKSIDSALGRIGKPYEVGTIISTQEIEKNIFSVLYTNKKDSTQLYGVILKKYGPFYHKQKLFGALALQTPHALSSGEVRSNAHITWYDKEGHYQITVAAYDKDIGGVSYRDYDLTPIPFAEYRIFSGSGKGDSAEYQLYDKNGNELEHYKP